MWSCIAAILLVALSQAIAQTADDQYLRIYGIIEQGDALLGKGQTNQALAKYREADLALQSFQKGNRDWNPKLIAYRFRYLAQQIETLSAPVAGTASTNAPAATPAQPSPAQSAFKAETKVIELGAEPRQELRLHPKPGDKQTANMTLKTTVDTTMAGMPSQAAKAPTLNMTYETTVKSVSESGDITYDLVVKETDVPEEPGVLPQAVAPLKTALAGMQGLSGTGTISSRGQSKGFKFQFPTNAPASTRMLVEQMKDAFVNLSASLPKEPLGVGAKWEVKEPLASQGVTIQQTSSYELASLQGEHAVIKSTVVQSAANQTVQVPSMPGMKLKLTKFVGNGIVSTTFDLGQLLPAERVTQLHTEQHLDMNAGGQPQSIVVKTDVSLRLETK